MPRRNRKVRTLRVNVDELIDQAERLAAELTTPTSPPGGVS